MGIYFLNNVPGLVVEIPFGDEYLAIFRQRSMVDRLMLKSNVLVSGLHDNSPSLSSTDTISGMKGCHRFEQIFPQVSQIFSRISTTSPL
jgi:hypothetical protein